MYRLCLLSISSWALRWVASKPNVNVVLSGMSTMEQVEDNLHTFDKFEPLTEKETNLIAKTADNIKKRTKNGCTGCAYCMPCDNLHTFDKFEPLTEKETNLIAKTADNIKKRTKNGCTGCAYCMPCPFGI